MAGRVVNAAAWEFQRDRAADAIGRLRRRHPDADDYDRILVDRIAETVLSLDAMFVGIHDFLDGDDYDRAFAELDRHDDRLRSRMGVRP
jgi:hypothetical protein